MHASILLAALALCPFALAAPPRLPSHHTRSIYGRQDGSVPEDSTAPSCDLSNIAQPPNTLTPPSSSMRLILIALGQGTQNYTCALPTSSPSPIGAIALLYNASCAFSTAPTTAPTDLTAVQDSPSIGTHFFVDNTTPDFDIAALGNTQMEKVEDVGAPDPSCQGCQVVEPADAEYRHDE